MDTVLGVTPKTVTAQFNTRWLKPACAKAGVRRFTPHGVRRMVVDELQNAGVDVGTAQNLSGHSPEVMLKHYRGVTAQDLKRGVKTAGLGTVKMGVSNAKPVQMTCTDSPQERQKPLRKTIEGAKMAPQRRTAAYRSDHRPLQPSPPATPSAFAKTRHSSFRCTGLIW